MHITISHYENTPIQIYWKFPHKKLKVSDKNSDISDKYNNVYPHKPQFYHKKKWCLKGVKII